ncbi:hypothetical protein TSUD_301780 [Trifolium subterraneum]|uniref:Uncharacterized protein n=1 Tax=Trifolium subterraneum TaxID=3900 RepID=A0A2Z6P303_TRISU|nr:hypothetical protein TSUD_301780 [Trifolium subterraneum]
MCGGEIINCRLTLLAFEKGIQRKVMRLLLSNSPDLLWGKNCKFQRTGLSNLCWSGRRMFRERSLMAMSRVGFFKKTMDFQSFHERLVMEGQFEVRATYMGGNMVLLQSSCESELSAILSFNKKWWDLCFYKIFPWKPNFLSESREIWIQIYGLPLHAWEESSFKMVAGRFGVFLDFDEATVAKDRFDVARVKLRTVRRGMIDTVLQLLVLGVAYDVWVVEERCSCYEREAEEEEGFRGSVRSNSNSGKQGWKREDDELFSDGNSDSDKSEPTQVLLD